MLDNAVKPGALRARGGNTIAIAASASLGASLGASPGILTLLVRDDGCGFDVAASRARAAEGASIGLLGMRERAMLADGMVELLSSAGQGTRVEAVFPLRNAPSMHGALAP